MTPCEVKGDEQDIWKGGAMAVVVDKSRAGMTWLESWLWFDPRLESGHKPPRRGVLYNDNSGSAADARPSPHERRVRWVKR